MRHSAGMGQSHGANPRTAPSYPQHSCGFSTPLPTLTEASELIAKEMVPELAGVRNGNESLRSQPWPSHQLLGRTDPREEAYERTPLFAPATIFHLRNIRPVRDLPDGLQPSPEALSRPRQSVLWWGAPHGPRQHRALSWHCRHRRGNLTALRSLFPGISCPQAWQEESKSLPGALTTTELSSFPVPALSKGRAEDESTE